MSFYDFFKNIFGLRNQNKPMDIPKSDPSRGNEFKKPVWIDEYEEEDDDILSQRHGTHTFPVLTDPLEIHRYFEHQMELMQDMMKNFSMFSPSSFFEDIHEGVESNISGAVEQPKDDSSNLRDECLKRPDDSVKRQRSGFSIFSPPSVFEDLHSGREPNIFGAIEQPKDDSRNRGGIIKLPDDVEKNQRRDIDLDSRIGAEGLGKVIDDVIPGNQITPAIPAPRFSFFGESIVSQTIRRPDGTVETRTTKKRSDGTEETFVSVQKPDGSHDVHTETGLIPRSGLDVFSSRGTEEDFLFDMMKSFFGK